MVRFNRTTPRFGVSSILFSVVVSLLCLSGCATPNMQPFADGAAKLSTSVRLTNSSVETKLSTLAETHDALKTPSEDFGEAAKIFNDMANLASSYSASIAELAAAGETGGEAAQKVMDTINGFPELLGLKNPALIPASIGGLAVGNAIQQAAELWNRKEVQEDLLEAIEVADPAVQALANAFGKMYGRPVNGVDQHYPVIIKRAASLVKSGLKRKIGAKKLKFYKDSEKVESDAISTLGRNKSLSAEVEATLMMRERIRPDVLAYYSDVQAIQEWEARQLAISYLIADSARAWALEHKRLLIWFKQCGGARYLKNDCGQFSASSLSALASDLQFVMKGGN